MREAAALSSLGVVIALVLSRPHVRRVRIGPAHAAAAGVALMFATGLVGLSDVGDAVRVLWRPLLTVTAIMVMAAAASRLGVLARLAAAVFPLARGSTSRLFGLTFGLSALTAAILNNDAAVLLLTPLVVGMVKEHYPDRPSLLVPFAFVVFMAAGVAPLAVSNPMNMILADVVGIGFNAYAIRMLPISIVGWIVTFAIMRLVFVDELRADHAAKPEQRSDVPTMSAAQWQMVGVLLVVLGSYPVVAMLDGPIWIVAGAGALAALALCARNNVGPVSRIVSIDVSWETLGFLVGALVIAVGLRNAGVVDWLVSVYRGGELVVIGAASAVGSAVINNHPMALINLLALDRVADSADPYFAALIGGDLGPRLLPNGSLAGLLWFASLRRLGVEISIRRFATVGAAVTIPTLAISIAFLYVV